MSTSVMSTPSSTHAHSTPLGTPTSPPLTSTARIQPPSTATGFAPATDVDQLFADMLAYASVPAQQSVSEPSAADQAFVDALLSTAADVFPQQPQPQPAAPAIPDPDLFAFLSAVPEDELQAMLTAADAVLDEDDDEQSVAAAKSRPVSAFQSPIPQPEDRLLTDDDDENDDTSSLPGSAFAPPPRNPHQDENSDQEDQDLDGDEHDALDAYNVRYGRRVIQVRNLEEGEVSGLSPPIGVLNDFTNTSSSSSDASDADDNLPVTPPRGSPRGRPYSMPSPTRSDDVIPPHSDLFAAAPLPSAPGPNINALFERHVVPTLVTSDVESAGDVPAAGTASHQAHHDHQDDEHEFGSPAAMPVFDDTTTLGAPASTMHQLRFAPLTVWTTAPLPFPQHLQYDAPPTPAPLPPMRPPSATSTASTRTSTTTSAALIDALPWGQAEVVDSPYRRRRPRKPSMRVYPRYQPPTHHVYEPSGLQVPMSPASPSSYGYGHQGYMSPPPPPPPPAYHMAAPSASASASSTLPSPHGSNESVPGRGMSPPPTASTAWAASAGYSVQQQHQQQQMRGRNVEYSASMAAQSASSEHRSRDRYGRSAGGW